MQVKQYRRGSNIKTDFRWRPVLDLETSTIVQKFRGKALVDLLVAAKPDDDWRKISVRY